MTRWVAWLIVGIAGSVVIGAPAVVPSVSSYGVVLGMLIGVGEVAAMVAVVALIVWAITVLTR